MTHYIRLRGPWEFSRGSETGPESFGPTQPIQLPAGWQSLSDRDWAGPLQLRRRFGRPTGISDTERVELVIAGASGTLEATLNGRELCASSQSDMEWRADVTQLLELRNELCLVVRAAFAEARLEITSRVLTARPGSSDTTTP